MTIFRMIWDQAVNHGNFSFFILLINIMQFVVGTAALVIAILAITR